MQDIVVARYNENLDWLNLIPKHFNIIIYNKGDTLTNIKNNWKIIQLQNIGRESHTYLQHIINNYDTLADKTVFCQGDTLFHSPNFIELLKNNNLFDDVQPLSSYYSKDIPPKEVTEEMKYVWIKNMRVHFEYVNTKFETVYPYFYNNRSFSQVFDKIKYNLTEYIMNKHINY